MASVGSVIPNYMAAPHGIGYSDKAVRPQDLGAWETQEKDDAYTQDDPWRTFEEDLDPKVAR